MNRQKISGLPMIFALVISASQADTIYLLNGTTKENVEILEEKFNVIRFKEKDLKQEIKAEKVASLTRSQLPSKFRRGDVALKSGQYAEAIKQFESCADESADWVKAQALYFKAVALRQLGKSKEAAAAFEAFVAAHGEHFYAPDALYQAGQCWIEAGDAAKATSAFESLMKTFGKDKDFKKAELLGEFGTGLALLSKKQGSDARRAFENVVRKGGRDEEFAAVVSRAQLEAGRTFLLDKRFDQAEKHFSSMAESASDVSVLAGVYHGLGAALQGMGGNENLRKAQLAYLRVILLFSNQRDLYKQSLEGAIEVSKSLGDTKRAKDLEEELKRAFGG